MLGSVYKVVSAASRRPRGGDINGIPLNTPESHEVYWVDHPDLLWRAGVGAGPARGRDRALRRERGRRLDQRGELRRFRASARLPIEGGAGSFGTTRFTVQYESGLLDDTYAFSGRYSRIVSQGYREQSWSRLWSYQFSAARLDSWMTTRVNLYGGPERLHLAYFAVDRAYLDGRITGDPDQDRRFNPLTWRNETDNFFEPHYELIQDVKLSDRASLASVRLLFPGKGYYDDIPYGPQSFASRRLRRSTSPPTRSIPPATTRPTAPARPSFSRTGSISSSRRTSRSGSGCGTATTGWVPRARLKHGRGTLTVGAGGASTTGATGAS